MKLLFALALLLPAFPLAAQVSFDTAKLREGDLVYIHSQSSQAGAIAEATGSDWTHVGVLLKTDKGWEVAEAARTVAKTPLADFLARSRGGGYEVKRLKAWGRGAPANQLKRLKKGLDSYLGKPYDIYFEWSDDAIYCSEYAWKAYSYALGGSKGLPAPQKFSDIKLDGPLASALFTKRYAAEGRKFNTDEPIVTPGALFGAPQFETVAAGAAAAPQK